MTLDELTILDSITERTADTRQRTDKRKALEAEIAGLQDELAELRSDPFNSADDIRFFRMVIANQIESLRQRIREL